MGNVDAFRIASFLNKTLIGDNISIELASSLKNIQKNSLAFIKGKKTDENKAISCLYLVSEDKSIDETSKASYIKVENPRLAFAKVVTEFFSKKFTDMISETSKIDDSAHIGKNVYIGNYSIIGKKVFIDDNTIIRDNVTIHDDVHIGKKCLIRSGAVLGEDGFGFEFEDDGTPIRMPHLGGILIGNNVEIGANCVIAKGTLDDTVIENDVKIDALVHIAHNCRIGSKTSLIAGATLSGSVTIGERCWIAPNSTIYQKKIIENDAKIGIGAVVIDNVEKGEVLMGLEAIKVFDLYKFKLKQKYQYNRRKGQ